MDKFVVIWFIFIALLQMVFLGFIGWFVIKLMQHFGVI